MTLPQELSVAFQVTAGDLLTNTDGTQKYASFGGCGCAGGEVVTLTDEGTIDAGVAKRRQQKIYSDVLGRTVKTEVLNWEGGSVYSTTMNTYNARDQVTLVRQYWNDDFLTRVAQKLEPDANISDWDHALQNHCLPSNRRYNYDHTK